MFQSVQETSDAAFVEASTTVIQTSNLDAHKLRSCFVKRTVLLIVVTGEDLTHDDCCLMQISLMQMMWL